MASASTDLTLQDAMADSDVESLLDGDNSGDDDEDNDEGEKETEKSNTESPAPSQVNRVSASSFGSLLYRGSAGAVRFVTEEDEMQGAVPESERKETDKDFFKKDKGNLSVADTNISEMHSIDDLLSSDLETVNVASLIAGNAPSAGTSDKSWACTDPLTESEFESLR
jgi:hypothetical protein